MGTALERFRGCPFLAGVVDGAIRSGTLRALAVAHTGLALLAALDGDRRSNDAHYLRALRAAEEAPDLVQVIRIRTKRAAHFIEEGSYTEGLQELEVAIRLAELASFASFLSADNPRAHSGRLREAASIWREIGDPAGEAKSQLALARMDSSPAAPRRREAESQVDAHGLRTHVGRIVGAGILAMVARADPMPMRIQSFGGFAVLRDGQSVKTSEWQSRRARELLKFLVARRGRPAPRPLLMEALWPDGDADRLGNRLSVALTTIRMVLDPQRRFSPGEFVHADKESVALNLVALDVDLERFLASASAGLGHLRRGDAGRAIPLLEAAEVMYVGDFLEENLYDDWATPPREEARAAYIAVARALAVHAVRRTDPDGAVRYFLRILQVDRFDEEAHLGLVAALNGAGRHGEAHRQYLNYRHAMDELDVEPVAFSAAALRNPKPAA